MTHRSCRSTFEAGLALLFLPVVCLHAGFAAGPVATQCSELRNGSASSRVGLSSDGTKRDGKITGRIWAGSGGGWGTKRPATIKISIYVRGAGDKEFCKVSFTYWGEQIPNVRNTGCRHKDRQVHVQRAKRGQVLTRVQLLLLWNGGCGKLPLCPLKEWHHWNLLSQKQVLLGAGEIILPGFLWLSILWLIIRG